MMLGFGCKAGMLPCTRGFPQPPGGAGAGLGRALRHHYQRRRAGDNPRELLHCRPGFPARHLGAVHAADPGDCYGIMGSMLAYKEKLLKKRMAYSTVSQVSYVLFGLFLFTPEGLMGALLQVVFHAVAKNILFLSVGSIIFMTHKTYAHELRGIGKQMPIVMWCFYAVVPVAGGDSADHGVFQQMVPGNRRHYAGIWGVRLCRGGSPSGERTAHGRVSAPPGPGCFLPRRRV